MNLFAALEIEREPPTWLEVPEHFAMWLRDWGMVAAIAILICGLSYLLERRSTGKKLAPLWMLFLAVAVCSFMCYGIFFAMIAAQGLVAFEFENEAGQRIQSLRLSDMQENMAAVAGGLACLAVTLPMVVGLFGRIRFRRIWAIARLSMLESIRNRTIFIFGLMGLVFLFYGFFVSYKPEDQIRNYVMVVFTPMTILFLITAALLGAFSIPVDVTRQTIHTIVTKPVERYEIVLGRFLGHGMLLTVMLAILSVLSLGYVLRGVNPRAADESLKARVPIYADSLLFHGTDDASSGQNVGREWHYRTYINGRRFGSKEARQYAYWNFESVPGYLADQTELIPFEFTFDIYRTTKGKEGVGVYCDVIFVDGVYGVEDLADTFAAFQKEYNTEQERVIEEWKGKESKDGRLAALREARDKLIAKYRVVKKSVEVTDYHTQIVKVSPSLLRGIRDHDRSTEESSSESKPKPMLKVLVTISESDDDLHSRQQLLGMARRDLYIKAGELPFWQNFLKGAIGLWCATMLILGIAVGCSTYFSGMISLMVTMFFLIAGAAVDFIRTLATGSSVGGGPFEAANRMFQKLPPAAPLEKTAVTAVGTGLDSAYQLYLNFVLKFIPDIHRYNLTEYIAEGFDIAWINIVFFDSICPMLSYLIPWAVLAYYLMNSREVANPT